MTKFPRRRWQDMTTVEFSEADTSGWIAMLPVCAIEQHGPHLPVATDTTINEGNVAAMLEKLPADLPLTVLPTQAVGKSNEHIHSPGTLTLSHDTLARLLLDIGDSVARAGVRKLVLANSHGGNIAVLDVVARELRVRHGMLVVVASWSRLGQPPGLYDEWEQAYGIHGGDMETSVMLALTPDVVKMDKAQKFHSLQERLAQRHKHLRAHGTAAFGWIAQDLGPHGVVGDASKATAEKGAATIATVTDRMIELLQDIHAFDMAALYVPAR
ncbi:MAG: creatininase family protein [Beijerinckiaceae bacterium]